MGLDMTLKMQLWGGFDLSDRDKQNVLLAVGLTDFNVSLVEVELGTWRNAIHIHRWFVNNVQGGVDDCEEYLVTHTKLKELLRDCKRVKEDNSLSMRLLPVKKRVLYGDSYDESDELYYEEIDRTIKIIEKILSKINVKDRIILYESSW